MPSSKPRNLQKPRLQSLKLPTSAQRPDVFGWFLSSAVAKSRPREPPRTSSSRRPAPSFSAGFFRFALPRGVRCSPASTRGTCQRGPEGLKRWGPRVWRLDHDPSSLHDTELGKPCGQRLLGDDGSVRASIEPPMTEMTEMTEVWITFPWARIYMQSPLWPSNPRSLSHLRHFLGFPPLSR